MPETTFAVRWPDGEEQTYYSPSLVVHELLEPGTAYQVGELVLRAGAAMQEASDRVRATFGFACTRAMATLGQVQDHASRFASDDTAEVVAA